MQIFLSYSHDDAASARFIAEALRAAKVDVWLDEERMRGGGRTQAQIVAAARRSAHAIFLVSPAWLESQWAAKELDLFAARANCRRIALLLAPRREMREDLPAGLIDVMTIEWLPQSSTDAVVWQTYCAVHDVEPGPSRDWASMGRARVGPDVMLEAPALEPASATPPSVFCNRERQWTMFDPLTAQRQHHIIFLAGARGQAHDTFVTRIERRLQRGIVHRVAWSMNLTSGADGRPASKDQFRDAIAAALNVRPADLVRKLRGLLLKNNVVLVHERICDDYEDPELLNYYAAYLPSLVEEIQPAMALKIVQGIEWIDRSWLERLSDRLLGREGPADARRARQLMSEIKRSIGSGFIVQSLPELETISREDVIRLCEAYNLTAADTSRLLDLIKAIGRTSQETLNAIDDFLRGRRRRPILQIRA